MFFKHDFDFDHFQTMFHKTIHYLKKLCNIWIAKILKHFKDQYWQGRTLSWNCINLNWQSINFWINQWYRQWYLVLSLILTNLIFIERFVKYSSLEKLFTTFKNKTHKHFLCKEFQIINHADGVFFFKFTMRQHSKDTLGSILSNLVCPLWFSIKLIWENVEIFLTFLYSLPIWFH